MKYHKAELVLPAALLREIRKYVNEGMLYIKKHDAPRRGWGELSGERIRLDERNARICARHRQQTSIQALADEFHLSLDTVKKIVYKK